MRIIILSIALLFCAVSAHSQVLKSAGVWYFLDVDSMTARPAVLPNGTELAYVIGTRTLYKWNRGSSAWEVNSSGGLTMPFDSIYFTPSSVAPDTAELKYSSDYETFVFGADGTTIEIGQKEAWYVKNQTGSTINKGTVVRASGTLGSSGRILISPMVIDGTVSSKYLLGITASNISNGSDGYVIDFGKLRKFNTSAWSDGAVLYAGAGGTLTATEPNPPNLRLPIAFVVHSHATNGVLAIRIQTGNELHELHDVDTTGINTGEGLVYNSTLHKWQASAGKAITTADTTSLLATKYWTNSNFFPLQGGTLTGTGGAGFLGLPSQVSAPGTPASGLNIFAQGSSFNWTNTGGFQTQITSSSLTGGRTYDLPNASGFFALGTGTADRSARWSATNILAAGNMTDNGTKLQALLPFQLHQWTTAGRPTGVNGYMGYNTSFNGIEWYNGTRWAYALESTFARGTATRIPFFDANGQITDISGFTYASNYLSVPYLSTRKILTFDNDIFINNGETQTNRIRFYTPAGTDNLMYFYVGGVYKGQFTTGNTQFSINHVNSIYIAQQGGTNPYVKIGNGGTSIGIGSIVNPSYYLHIQGTDAIGLPRGTISTRPTIISETTPFRYNIDSTAIEYGESAGVWRQLSTRAYSRSLVSGLSPDTWLGSRLPLGDITINANFNELTFSKLDKFKIKSGTGKTRVSIDTFSGGALVYLNKIAAGTGIGSLLYFNDTTGVKDNQFYQGQADFLFSQNTGSGHQYLIGAIGDRVVGGDKSFFAARNDTSATISVMRLMYGDRYSSPTTPDVHVFRGAVPNVATVYQPTFYFNSSGASGKLAASIDESLFVRENGKVYFASDSTFSFDPSNDVLRLSQYGTGTKEASDLSKTESVYTAIYATDGTLIEKRANTEQYNAITSTTSPVTLSSTIADNLINQGSTQATFTLNMPASPVDGQIVMITYNNAITTLTIDGNGNTIVGSAVTTAVAGSQRKFKFYTGIGWIKQY